VLGRRIGGIVLNGCLKINLGLAGSRTRIDCLEGDHANRYTTDA
jgi:hypothetical protein